MASGIDLQPQPPHPELLQQALELGFAGVSVLPLDAGQHPALEEAGEYLHEWLAQKRQGRMEYMQRHGSKRWRPGELEPGTLSVIVVQLNYMSLPQSTELNNDPAAATKKKSGIATGVEAAINQLEDPQAAYISRYALGRDYHKTMRQQLKKLSQWLETWSRSHDNGPNTDSQYNSRVFADSAPVMEKALAQAAGLGWIGKHTLLLNRSQGSWFFLGEVFTNIPAAQLIQPSLEKTTNAAIPTQTLASKNHCGACSKCIDVCPTQAIVAPYQLDARKCISYLTIENKEAIPIEYRQAIGNRVFGCDDCQLYCPWNRFAQYAQATDFTPRHNLDTIQLVEAFLWTAAEFDLKTQGSPIRRTGYQGWIRNIAVGLGNAPTSKALIQALQQQQTNPDILPIAQEHIQWALEQHVEW